MQPFRSAPRVVVGLSGSTVSDWSVEIFGAASSEDDVYHYTDEVFAQLFDDGSGAIGAIPTPPSPPPATSGGDGRTAMPPRPARPTTGPVGGRL